MAGQVQWNKRNMRELKRVWEVISNGWWSRVNLRMFVGWEKTWDSREWKSRRKESGIDMLECSKKFWEREQQMWNSSRR